MDIINWIGGGFVIALFLGFGYIIIFCKNDDELDEETHDIENQQDEL